MSLDGNDLGGADAGHGSGHSLPVRGTADMARRGVRHIWFLPRVIQPRAGYRKHHDQPVPTALAEHRKTARRCRESVNARCDVSRAKSAGHEKGSHDQNPE
jgi:hypothetical protein